MNFSQSILLLAEQFLHNNRPLEQSVGETSGMDTVRFTPSDLQPLLNTLASAQTSSMQVAVSADLCAHLAAQNGHAASSGAIYFGIAKILEARPDLRSQELAIEGYQKARHRFPPGSVDSGRCLVNEANAWLGVADWGLNPLQNIQRARELYRQGRTLLNPRSEWYGAALTNEANTLVRLAELEGDLRTTLETARALYTEARQRLTDGTPSYGRALANEATARQKLADTGTQVTENLQRAIELYKAALLCFPAHSASSGRALGNLGNLYGRLADLGMESAANLQAALTHYAQALPCFAPESHACAVVQNSIALAHHKLAGVGSDPQANLRIAFSGYEQALRQLLPGTPAYGRTLGHMAALRREMAVLSGEPRPLLQDALRLCDEALPCFPEGDEEIAVVEIHRANVYISLYNLDVTQHQHLRVASRLFQQVLDHKPRRERIRSMALRGQAHALYILGYSESAFRRLRAGLGHLETTRAQMTMEQERVAYFRSIAAQHASLVEYCSDLATESSSPQQREAWLWEAWHAAHCAKMRTFLEAMASPRLRLTEEDRPLWDRVERLSGRLDQVERRQRQAVASGGAVASESGEGLDRLRRTYRRQRAEVLRRVEGRYPRPADAVSRPQALLPFLRQLGGLPRDRTRRPVLVEFFVGGENGVTVFLKALWTPEPLQSVRIATPLDTLRRLAASWAQGLQQAQASLPEPGTPLRASAEEARTRARADLETLLREMEGLLAPWMPAVMALHPTELVFSGHASLNALPLHAVAWHGQPLIAHFPIAYLPSPALAPDIARQHKPLRGPAVLLGDPTRDLAHTQTELLWVERQFQRQGLPVTKLLANDVTTETVRTLASTATVLHFAGHSVLEPEDFLRSGMELADRRLTALDISVNLELSNATLVFLSSCNGALTVPDQTEELMALARVFFAAGSPSVIGSLWPVEDRDSSEFAALFYRFWLGDKQARGTALQQAVCTMHQRGYHPIAWAPFLLMGAWQEAVS